MTDVPRILIVEDVATDAMLIELELRRAGLQCTTRRVDTAEELVRALRHFSPDVVLSDHALSQFSATGTLDVVRSWSPETPVIIVTGSLDEETAVDYINAGATDYVIKQHLGRLGPAVMRALALRRIRRREAEYAVARILAESPTVADAGPRILQAIGESLDWGVGHLWGVDPNARVLRCDAVWCAPGLNVQRLRAATRDRVFPVGTGLPGRAWRLGEAVWIEDVSKVFSADPPRYEYAAAEGLRGLFVLPIKNGQEVIGVLEFFSREIQQPDAHLLDLARALGNQIGRFIERRRAQDVRVHQR